MRFTIDCIPKAKGRPRTVTLATGYVSTYTPAPTRQYENKVRAICQKACKGRHFQEGVPLRVEAWFYMPIPRSGSKATKERLRNAFHTVKPDIDNLMKSILDGCNKCAYADDNQVSEVYAHKKYSDCPRTEVIIRVCEGGLDQCRRESSD